MTKWLPDVAPTDRAVDVAIRSMRSRLDAVWVYFRRAVKEPEEPENFHQLRVWSRRAEAALDLYSDFMPRGKLKRMRRTLKRARRAAGRVRDCDVYGKRVAGAVERWPRRLADERARAVNKLIAEHKRLGPTKRLRARTRKLLKSIVDRNVERKELFAERARNALRPIATAFFAASPDDVTAEKALHRFRLAGKDLRYAMELVSPAFAPPFRDELYPALGVLQEKLGHLNDLASIQLRLLKRIDRSGDPAELSDLRRRQAAAAEELLHAREDFRRWWTPESRDSMRTRFEGLLGPLRGAFGVTLASGL